MVCKNDKIDPGNVMNVKYLAEFDQAVQCPTWGYPTAGAYHRDASSVDSVFSIRIPCLAVHAEDDPVCMLKLSIRGFFADNISDRCRRSCAIHRDQSESISCHVLHISWRPSELVRMGW